MNLFDILPEIKLEFNESEILFKNVRDEIGTLKGVSDERKYLLDNMIDSDKCISDINERLYNKVSGFNALLINDNQVCPTITAGEKNYRKFDKLSMSDNDYVKCGTFPLDYNFNDNDAKYLIGMSVPPVMTANIATEIYSQWLSRLERS